MTSVNIEWEGAVASLAEHLPPGSSVVAAARMDPELPLARQAIHKERVMTAHPGGGNLEFLYGTCGE